MRQTGLGTFYDYDDLSDDKKRFSADRKRAAAVWVSRRRQDRYDEDTAYEVAVWDVATKKQVEAYTRIHSIDHHSGEQSGQAVKDVRFDPSGTLLLVLGDGRTEPAQPDLGEPPEKNWKGPPPPLFKPSS